MIELILGGARSGKSTLALQKAINAGGNDVVYIATATSVDDEMATRIARHQQDRPADWQLVESPLALAEAIESADTDKVILVDCLTLWLNNHLYQQPEQDFTLLFDQLLEALETPKHIILVANEVGLGIIPLGQVNRRFVDEAGRLNRLIAQKADNVFFVVAGIEQQLKGERP